MNKKATMDSRDDDVTYVAGLGFVPGNLGPSVTGQIRRLTNLVCLLLLADEFLRRLLSLPAAYLASLLGMNITINSRSGMIVMSDEVRLFIEFVAAGVSLLLISLIALVAFRRTVRGARVFGRPHPGSLAVSIPILVAVGLLSAVLVYYLGVAARVGGLVLGSMPEPVSALDGQAALSFLFPLSVGLLQECILRGVILSSLRKFGDGFAILASALLAAVWADGLLPACFAFLFGVAAGYFVVRSGSVWVAVAGRALLGILFFGFRIANGMLDASLAVVVILVVLLLFTAIALLAYLRFIKLDPRAFRLQPPPSETPPSSTPQRLCAFCSSLLFLLLTGILLFQTVSSLQLIGW